MIAEIDPFVIGLVALTLPVIQAIIQKPHWSSNAKLGLTLILAVLGGMFLAWWSDMWSKEGITTGVMAVFAASQISYSTLFKRSGLGDVIEQTINGDQ